VRLDHWLREEGKAVRELNWSCNSLNFDKLAMRVGIGPVKELRSSEREVSLAMNRMEDGMVARPVLDRLILPKFVRVLNSGSEPPRGLYWTKRRVRRVRRESEEGIEVKLFL
jgi:hypothetical protein